MSDNPNLTRAAIMSADPQQLRLWCAEYVMGYIAWEEKRGDYIYYIWQKPGEREPWFRSRNWEILKKNYTPAGPYNPRIHIQPQGSLPDFPSEIGAAWLVVEVVQVIKSKNQVSHPLTLQHEFWNELWRADFGPFSAKGKTPSLAICRAALIAVTGAE